jgi:hypothetical protein
MATGAGIAIEDSVVLVDRTTEAIRLLETLNDRLERR